MPRKRNNRSNRRRRMERDELITLEEFSWTDYDVFRLDINDPITDEEYGNLYKNKEICLICLEEFNNMRKIIKISCDHYFHRKFIFDYILKEKREYICLNSRGPLDIVFV